MFPGSERQEEHAYQTCNHLLYEDKYTHTYKTQKYIYTNTLYPHKKIKKHRRTTENRIFAFYCNSQTHHTHTHSKITNIQEVATISPGKRVQSNLI